MLTIRAIRIANGWIEVDDEMIELARKRCQLDSFLGRPVAEPVLRIRRVRALAQPKLSIAGSPAPWGFISLDGSILQAEIPDDPFAAEAVLRAAVHLLVLRDGGLLIHSSGVAVNGRALVAVGQSGAGKSTFASLVCRLPGAQLLSDEIVALYPDGSAHGTPFRSDFGGTGTPERFPIASVFTLSKGHGERVDEIAVTAGVAAVMAQTYQAPIEPLPRAEILKRVAALVSQVGVRQLTFRKDPAVADFVAQWVREQRPHS